MIITFHGNLTMDSETNTYTAKDYVYGCSGYPIGDDVAKKILFELDIEEDMLAAYLTPRDRDFLKMGVIEAILLSPSMTASVADADGNWSHKEGATESNAVDRNYLRSQLRDLRKKWGLAVEPGVKLHMNGIRLHRTQKV